MIPFVLSILLFSGISYYGIRHIAIKKRRTRKQRELATAYQRLLFQHRVAVHHYEIIGNRIFAFGRKNKKLIVVDHNTLPRQELCISLLSVSETKIVEEKNGAGKVERLFLQMRHKWSNAVHRICFFDQAYDGSVDLPFSARCAELWKNRIDVHKYPGIVLWSQEYVL